MSPTPHLPTANGVPQSLCAIESRCNFIIGENAAFLCSHFGWQLVNFVYSKTDLSNSGFLSYFYNQVSDTKWCEAELLKDVLSTRDDKSEIMFADGSGL